MTAAYGDLILEIHLPILRINEKAMKRAFCWYDDPVSKLHYDCIIEWNSSITTRTFVQRIYVNVIGVSFSNWEAY